MPASTLPVMTVISPAGGPASLAPAVLDPLWRAADDALALLSVRTDIPDAVALQAAVRTMLNAIYDLTEAWAVTRYPHKKDRLRGQNLAAAGDEAGEVALALIRARHESTHSLVLDTRESTWGEGIYGAGVYGSADRRWATTTFRSLNNKELDDRAGWFVARCENELVKDTIASALAWLSSGPTIARTRT